jgi:hypothetical protein
MQLTKMKIEKRDIPVIAFSALAGLRRTTQAVRTLQRGREGANTESDT